MVFRQMRWTENGWQPLAVRGWVWEADRDRLGQQTLDSRPRLLSAAEGRRRPRLGKES